MKFSSDVPMCTMTDVAAYVMPVHTNNKYNSEQIYGVPVVEQHTRIYYY